MYRWLVGGFLFVYFIFSAQTSAYLEDRFFCAIDQNTITVSIASGTSHCFAYMDQISTALATADEDITQAEKYITDRDDIGYRLEVRQDLLQKKQNLENLRYQFDVAVTDYEQELFVKVKGIVGYYLMPKRQVIMEKLEKADFLLTRLKLLGDEENYRFVVQQIEILQHHLILLDRIRFAYSFAELLPPLKLYINGGGFELDLDPTSVL